MRLLQQISLQRLGNYSLLEANLAVLHHPFLHQHLSHKPEGVPLIPVVLCSRAGGGNLLPWWPLHAHFQPVQHGANIWVNKLSLQPTYISLCISHTNGHPPADHMIHAATEGILVHTDIGSSIDYTILDWTLATIADRQYYV